MRKIILVLFLLLPAAFGCKENALHLKIRYDQIQGLQKGDRVIFENHHIGSVKDVAYSKQGFYMVDIVIEKNFSYAATELSRFLIITDPQNVEKKAVEIIQTGKGGTPLRNNSIVEGTAKTSAFLDQFLDQFLEGFGGIKKEFEQFLKDLKGIPENEEFKKLEDELKRLKEEMKKSGEEVRRKIQEELLPQLKEEMEKLRERLREFGREDEMKPLETEMEEMKKI